MLVGQIIEAYKEELGGCFLERSTVMCWEPAHTRPNEPHIRNIHGHDNVWEMSGVKADELSEKTLQIRGKTVKVFRWRARARCKRWAISEKWSQDDRRNGAESVGRGRVVGFHCYVTEPL